jgi:hypothetical protein
VDVNTRHLRKPGKKLRLAALAVGLLLLVVTGGALYLTSVPGASYIGTFSGYTEIERATAARIKTHVTAIASRPHNIEHYDDLEAAARYIENELEKMGYIPKPQVFEADGKNVRNIEVIIEPRSGDQLGSVVVGAHYDSYRDAPGANDNGSGTAALLEIARIFKANAQPDARIRLVFFVNEEPPYFQDKGMGSAEYAKMLANVNERLIGMISLETIGYYKGPQNYPFPLGLLYPSTGNFVAFVGMIESRAFVRATVKAFRERTMFPSDGGVAPGFIPGIDWSDHWSFARYGYPALMVTDTAYFRDPHYHQITDLPANVDSEKVARVAHGMAEVIWQMASQGWPTESVGPAR